MCSEPLPYSKGEDVMEFPRSPLDFTSQQKTLLEEVSVQLGLSRNASCKAGIKLIISKM